MPGNPSFATQKIVKATFNRVDLVPAGANSESHVVLFKSKGGQEMPRLYQEIIKSLPEDEQAVMTAEIQKEKDETVRVQGELDTLTGTINKAKEETLSEDELILKSLEGPAKAAFLKIKKERDDLNAETTRLEEEKLEKSITDELSEVEFAKSIEGFEDNYIKLAKESPELKTALLELLKQVDEVVDTSELFKEYGSSNSEDQDDEDQLEQLAKEKAKAEGITFEKAFSQVLVENPELYQG